VQRRNCPSAKLLRGDEYKFETSECAQEANSMGGVLGKSTHNRMFRNRY